MKIVSWNINSLRKRQDRFFEWLETFAPEIICLQETKCTDEQFPALALQAAGYRSAYHGEKSYNGVAILAKNELREVRASLYDEVVDPQARVIAATVGQLRVFSIYAPNGQAVGSPAYQYKLQWYRRLRHCLAKEKSIDLVVCGDFNVAPEDIDVYNADLWHGAIMASDGDRDFCRLWIERWREMTTGKVDYTTYQKATDRFAEIPPDEFNRSLVLIQPDGTVVFAAEAVYRSLAYRRSREWLAWSYDHVPGFAAVSETGYGLIARHRKFASAVTRLLWGKEVRRPTYVWARRWFLRALGAIYLIAFVSLWVQADGLVGSNGISPVNQFLPAVRGQVGPDAYGLLPTLCWFNSSDAFLHFLCGSGVLCSLLLIFGIAPGVLLVALFVLYLSLTIAGQAFFNFQWDVLLLETGFLSIFFAPWRLWPRELSLRPRSTMPATAPVSQAG